MGDLSMGFSHSPSLVVCYDLSRLVMTCIRQQVSFLFFFFPENKEVSVHGGPPPLIKGVVPVGSLKERALRSSGFSFF